MWTAKTLIRLGGCPGWSESSLGAHAVLSRGGSISRRLHPRLALFYCWVGRIIQHLVYLSRLMRLWHLSPSVDSFFKHACTAIHWGYTSDFWSDPSSTSKRYVCEQWRLWRDCMVSPEPSLFTYVISTIISWASSFILQSKVGPKTVSAKTFAL